MYIINSKDKRLKEINECHITAPVIYPKVRCPDLSCFKMHVLNTTLLIIPCEGLIYPALSGVEGNAELFIAETFMHHLGL